MTALKVLWWLLVQIIVLLLRCVTFGCGRIPLRWTKQSSLEPSAGRTLSMLYLGLGRLQLVQWFRMTWTASLSSYRWTCYGS